MLTFTYIPSTGFEESSDSNILQASFGDGYSQRVANGINSTVRSWNLSFVNRTLVDSEAIMSFLKARNSVQSFLWTPPGEQESISVLAREWKKVYNSPITRNISVKFIEVFEK